MKPEHFPAARLALLASFVASCASAPEPSPGPAAYEIDTGSGGAISDLEATAHGFPQMRTLQGETMGEGEFTQWIEGERLHVRIHYDCGPQSWIEERSVIRQEPDLVQESWSWTQMQDGKLERRFAIDLSSGNATAEKLEKGELRRWSKHLDVKPGDTFAGFAWALAIRKHREQLLRGEKIVLQAVGFTPKPTAAKVEISYRGIDQLPMSGRTLLGESYVVHPKVPWIARPFIEAPDSRIWLTHPAPATFLRFEGPLAEPDDRIIRVDLLPGGPSGPAAPSNAAAVAEDR